MVLQRKLTRAKLIPFFEKLPPCRVGIEACATAHHWGRRLTELGHEVKLVPPSYVKPYVKRQKNDAADAEAICEALRQHLLELASSNSQQHTRNLRELGDLELRRDVLDALVDLAAADEDLSMTETALLRRTATALGLTQDDYVAAQARHRERLSVLR